MLLPSELSPRPSRDAWHFRGHPTATPAITPGRPKFSDEPEHSTEAALRGTMNAGFYVP